MRGSDSREDPAQLEALEHFQQLHDQLASSNHSPRWRFFQKLTRNDSENSKGVYIWGGVGRGKTYLMDLFYESVPIASKKRIHFHRFMQSIHHSLKDMRSMQNPLAKIGKDFAKRNRLLCLDEFFVLDIGDAVILSGLLTALIDHRVAVVMTSNTRPDDLYQGGLQRDRFFPAINLINSRMNVIKIGDGTDYRLKALSGKILYYDVLGSRTDAALREDFQRLSAGDAKMTGDLEILGRDIPTVCYSDHVVWFDFSAICDGPRSKADYIEIANIYRTVMVTGIPVLTWEFENQARRFVELVDEFYDRGVHLVVSAEIKIDSLYNGKRLVREFERTTSRLHEMQSERYLSRVHCG